MLRLFVESKNWWMRHVGRRGSALLFFAFLDLVYCWSLFTLPLAARRSPTFVYLQSYMAIQYWAALWGLVGVICLVSSFVRRDFIAFTAAITIKIVWSILYFWGDITGEVYRGYVSAAVWFALALLVKLIAGWPECPGGDKWTQESP